VTAPRLASASASKAHRAADRGRLAFQRAADAHRVRVAWRKSPATALLRRKRRSAVRDTYIVAAVIAATIMLSALVIAVLIAGPPVLDIGNRSESSGAGERGTERRVAREQSPRGPDTTARPSDVATELPPLEPSGGAAIASTAPRSELPPSPSSPRPAPAPAAVVLPSGASNESPLASPPESTAQADDPPPPDDPVPPPDDSVPPPNDPPPDDPVPPPDDPVPPPDDPPVPATPELSVESLQGLAVSAPLDSTSPL
jgi:hypothetical protein